MDLLFSKIKYEVTSCLNENILRISLGIVYTWFGVLKFFPDQSPAEDLAKETLSILSFELIPAGISYFLLALMETFIGLLLITNIFRKFILWLAFFHILCTFSPILIFPEEVFVKPFIPSLTGQYILKNLVLFAAILVIIRIKNRSDLN